jgi:hypothetical protein
MTKFSIIISYKEEMHLPRRNATISQKIMTMGNAKIHGQGGMQKFPSHQTQY